MLLHNDLYNNCLHYMEKYAYQLTCFYSCFFFTFWFS